MRRMTDRVLPVRLAGLEAQWFSLDCVAAHAGFPPIRLPELSRRRPSTPLHVPGRHIVDELWPGLGCIRIGTEKSPIKIVPRDADKDSHMALSHHLANRQGPERQFRPPRAPWLRRGPLLWPRHFLCSSRTPPRFWQDCSHDPGGTAVPSLQSWREQHIRKIIGLPRAIR